MIEVSFFVEVQPAAFDRATAAKSAVAGRKVPLPEKIATFRRAIWIEYIATINENPKFSHLPRSGDYYGRIEMETALYGSKADVLNVGKETEDALEGVAYCNDRQHVAHNVSAPTRRLSPEGTVLINKGETPGVRITLRFLDL